MKIRFIELLSNGFNVKWRSYYDNVNKIDKSKKQNEFDNEENPLSLLLIMIIIFEIILYLIIFLAEYIFNILFVYKQEKMLF